MTEWKKGVVRLAYKADVFGHVATHMSGVLWRVSHTATGYCCGQFSHEDNARKYAEKIGAHQSWKNVEIDKHGTIISIPNEITQCCKDALAEMHDMGEE